MAAADGWCHIAGAGGKYLHLGAGSGACGTSVCLWRPDGSLTQLWRFQRL